MSVRAQVLEQIIEVMIGARACGRDNIAAAAATFPGTPEAVLWSAWATLENRELEGWWEQVEKTIDGEIIRNALAKGAVP